jgi:hypothetical protein
MKINLPKNKHIAVILEPRSGSHAFRNYISSSLDILNLGEFLNPINPQQAVTIDKNKKTALTFKDVFRRDSDFDFDNIKINNWVDKSLTILNDVASVEHYAIFSLLIKNVLCCYPDVIRKIKNNPNIDFIRLKRIDVLYGIVSIEICKYTEIWHNIDQRDTFSRVNMKNKLNIPIDEIKFHLEMYIKCENLIKEIFGNVPVIYYEQWQNNIRNLNKIITLPNKLISIELTKFAGDYRDLISNINEIEDYYREFVKEHSEYFHHDHVNTILSQSINELY